MRLVLSAMVTGAISTIGGDGNHPVFLPQLGQVLNVGQPNADTVYRSAEITPGGSYRLWGNRGSLRMVSIGQTGGAKKKTGARVSDHDLNALSVDKDGGFSVLLSPERPADYEGDWWQLQPETRSLLLRMVSSDWGQEVDPVIAIERVDTQIGKPRPSAKVLEQRLRQLPRITTFLASLFVDHVSKLREQGFVNKLNVLDVSNIGGLSGQFYYEGVYDLADDEALIVESTVPKSCEYRSILLTNELYETTDWYNNHSSLNGSQAKPDADGMLRVVVSAKDPGVANWLDTAGYSSGMVQGRWTGCIETPIPSVRKVALAQLGKVLPADTRLVSVEERQKILRARRGALQQRPLW